MSGFGSALRRSRHPWLRSSGTTPGRDIAPRRRRESSAGHSRVPNVANAVGNLPRRHAGRGRTCRQRQRVGRGLCPSQSAGLPSSAANEGIARRGRAGMRGSGTRGQGWPRVPDPDVSEQRRAPAGQAGVTGTERGAPAVERGKIGSRLKPLLHRSVRQAAASSRLKPLPQDCVAAPTKLCRHSHLDCAGEQRRAPAGQVGVTGRHNCPPAMESRRL